jgi:hypothetical protein
MSKAEAHLRDSGRRGVGKCEGACEWEVVLRAIFLGPCFGGMAQPGRVTERGLWVRRIGARRV